MPLDHRGAHLIPLARQRAPLPERKPFADELGDGDGAAVNVLALVNGTHQLAQPRLGLSLAAAKCLGGGAPLAIGAARHGIAQFPASGAARADVAGAHWSCS
jgi:hypothetical protein